ncbi:Haloacid dehalogenase [Flavobacterium longum]|uniref:HAD family hydrolase n=1 Tax=Flavobacterium longum TaxID=1299340 RepID=UPI0039E99859
MKYLLLDVAGTLLHKPTVYGKMLGVLENHGHTVALQHLKYNHKMLSEAIRFPDRTDAEFYKMFNGELLYSLGIVPTHALIDDIFSACTYLPWEKFDDTSALHDVRIPIGILSNFNSTLKEKLKGYFGDIFSDVFVSEELGVAKPNIAFYQRALEKIGIAPQDILYVGDSFKLDLEPATKVGMKAFVVDRDGYFPNNPNVIASLTQIKDLL